MLLHIYANMIIRPQLLRGRLRGRPDLLHDRSQPLRHQVYLLLVWSQPLEVRSTQHPGQPRDVVSVAAWGLFTPNLPTKINPYQDSLTQNLREIPHGPGNSTPET